MRQSELVEIDALRDYQIVEGDPDPRGWAVVAGSGECVGKVRSLLVEPAAGKVRYLLAELSDKRCVVLLPLPLARLDPRARRVIFDLSTAATLVSLPQYTGTLPTEAECEYVRQVLADTRTARPNPDASADRRRTNRRGSSCA